MSTDANIALANRTSTNLLPDVVDMLVFPMLETTEADVLEPEVHVLKVAPEIPFRFACSMAVGPTGPTDTGPNGTVVVQEMLKE